MKRVPKYPKSVGVCFSEKRNMGARLVDRGPKAELRYLVEVHEGHAIRLTSQSNLTHVALGDFDRVCAGFKLGRPTWAKVPTTR